MPSHSWYYLHPDDDEDSAVGPLALSDLVKMIRDAELPEDVLVSTDQEVWNRADAVEDILNALPLDRERIFREYIAYGEAPLGQENWGWASARMLSILNGAPEIAWQLIVELIERAPSESSLSFFAAGPLEDLLSDHGDHFIERVELRAAQNAKFRHAVRSLRRLDMTDDVWRRVKLIAGG